MEQLINVLVKLGIVLAIALTIALVVFLFWNVIFYQYVKKHRIDDIVKKEHAELQELRVQKSEEYESVNKLLVEKQELIVENNSLKAENLELKNANAQKSGE